MIRGEIIEVSGSRWKVREAVSRAAAYNAISFARATGSVGNRDVRDETFSGGVVTVIADVVQINSDGTERQPYTIAY